MKKIFVLLLCAMVLFTACQPALPMEGSMEESKEESKASAPSEEASSEKLAEPSEDPGETSEEPKEPEPEEPQEPEPEEPKEPEESELWPDVPTQAAQVDYRSDDRTYTAVLETVEEKEAFFGEYASSALYGGPVKLEDRYDEAYFEKHRLLVAYTYAGSGSYRLGTESIRWKNGTLEWSYNVYSTGFGTCDMAGWVLLAELPRELPVTAETAVELKGYDVNFVQESVGECTEPEALLLKDPESLQAFLSRHCREDFWHDYMGYDIDRVDFEKESFIGVYLPLPVQGTVASFRGLTRTSEGVEVVIGCRIPSEAPDLLGGGCVWLLQVGKGHPAASGEKVTVKTEEEQILVQGTWRVVNPSGQQIASVHLQDPPEEATVLTTFGEKESFFAKYAQPDEDRYSEAFFESHVLLVVYQREPSMPINTVFDRMVLTPSGKLEVYFTRREPGPYDAVAQRLYFFEIPAEYAINGETPLQVLFQAPPTDN